MIKLISISLLLMTLFLGFFNSCQAYQLEKKFDPESREFLALVKHIITSEEHKRFLELPPGEREAFMEEFWRRRDPDTDTIENEFKIMYMQRVEEANEHFGSTPGNLTDRGMVYVLFGQPDEVYKSPFSGTGSGRDYEVWYYNYILDKYPEVQFYFIDRTGAGLYKLEKSNQVASVFSLVQEVKYYYLGTPKESDDKRLQFKVNIKQLDRKDNYVKLSVQVKLPYKNIWFSKTEDKMETTLFVDMEILDADRKKMWSHKQDYLISFVKDEFEELLKVKVNHVIEVTASVSADALSKGKSVLRVNLTNSAGGEKGKKVVRFKI